MLLSILSSTQLLTCQVVKANIDGSQLRSQPCEHVQVLHFGNFWIFFSKIFDLWWVESMDIEPIDVKDQLYNYNKIPSVSSGK